MDLCVFYVWEPGPQRCQDAVETRPRAARGRGMVINQEGNGKQRNEMGLRPRVILLLLISFQRCQNCNYVFIVNLAAH